MQTRRANAVISGNASMSESSTASDKHTPPLLWSLSVLLFAIEEVVFDSGPGRLFGGMPAGRGGFDGADDPGSLVRRRAGVVLLVGAGVSLDLCLHMQALFWGYSGPGRHAVLVDGSRESAPHVRLGICYGRAPTWWSRCHSCSRSSLCRFCETCTCFRTLPGVKIGERFVLAGFLYDPELIEIGDDVIVGGGCVMASHAHVVLRSNVQLYVRRLRFESATGPRSEGSRGSPWELPSAPAPWSNRIATSLR